MGTKFAFFCVVAELAAASLFKHPQLLIPFLILWPVVMLWAVHHSHTSDALKVISGTGTIVVGSLTIARALSLPFYGASYVGTPFWMMAVTAVVFWLIIIVMPTGAPKEA